MHIHLHTGPRRRLTALLLLSLVGACDPAPRSPGPEGTERDAGGTDEPDGLDASMPGPDGSLAADDASIAEPLDGAADDASSGPSADAGTEESDASTDGLSAACRESMAGFGEGGTARYVEWDVFGVVNRRGVAAVGPDDAVYLGNADDDSGTIVRFDAHGQRDSDYGEWGRVSFDETLDSLVMRPDGVLLATTGGYESPNLIYAFQPDGAPLTSFGQAGVLEVEPLRDSNSSGVSIVLTEDGLWAMPRYFGLSDAHVFKVHADGTLDTSVGDGGRVSVPVGALLGRAGGGFLLVERVYDEAGELLVAAAYDNRGQVDMGYGDGGRRRLGPDCQEELHTLSRPDGSLLVSCGTQVSAFTSTGNVDDAFGSDGRIDFGERVRVLANAAGQDFITGSSQSIQRWLADGRADPSFARTPIAIERHNGIASPHAIVTQQNGRVLEVATDNYLDGDVRRVAFTAVTACR